MEFQLDNPDSDTEISVVGQNKESILHGKNAVNFSTFKSS